MLGIYFEKCLVPGRYGVHVDIPEAEGLFIAMPERVQQCDDVEEAVVLFLEFIEKRIKFFVAASSLEISDLVIEQAIYENMGLITAVYYYSRGSVLNVTRKEDA